MHNSKKLTCKGISLLMAVIMLVGVMVVGFTASAATVFLDGSDPTPWSSTQNYNQGQRSPIMEIFIRLSFILMREHFPHIPAHGLLSALASMSVLAAMTAV